MTVVYVFFIILKKPIEDPRLGIVAFFVLIAGFVVKGVGFYLMNKNEEKTSNTALWLYFVCFGKFALNYCCYLRIMNEI